MIDSRVKIRFAVADRCRRGQQSIAVDGLVAMYVAELPEKVMFLRGLA